MIDFCTVVVLDFELKIVYLRVNLLHTCKHYLAIQERRMIDLYSLRRN